ncbi:MAG: SDR family NAD(P)-dependent oxidoreductase [Geminicoccaceae bacterium]|jgi:NAD(P)-dependent dehydrogenase (short-subunit alcohol dehydrogenase family)
MSTSSSADSYAPGLFAGRRILVVGGTSGIGDGIAAAFAALGGEVLVTGATAAEAAASGHPAVALDVRDEAAVMSMIAALPALDVLVNCAGIINRAAEHDLAVFTQVIDVNLAGTMRTCTMARPLLAATGGVIINLASVLSFLGGPLVPAYTASKGGVAQLTKALAVAYAPQGIRVNALAPGWIETPLTKAIRDDPIRSAQLLARTPLGRFGQPDDVAGAALFLASPAARFVTGTILTVDGGFLAL